MKGSRETPLSDAVVFAGAMFGKLSVVAISGRRGGRVACRCECGKVCEYFTSRILTGDRTSCGCSQFTSRAKVHGLYKSPEYQVWADMVQRCDNPKTQHFHRYGGRGITVCAEWKTFSGFIKDVGQRPSAQHSIDRINNEGNYEPGNVRWATKKEQDRNRSTNTVITLNGKSQILADWAAEIGIPVPSMLLRLRRWTLEQALTTPKLKKGQRINR